MAKFTKTLAITECICCGGTNLTHVDIDTESIDISGESVHFSTGYHCEDCGNISHTDGEEVSFTIVQVFEASLTKLSGDTKDESWWPNHSADPRTKQLA